MDNSSLFCPRMMTKKKMLNVIDTWSVFLQSFPSKNASKQLECFKVFLSHFYKTILPGLVLQSTPERYSTHLDHGLHGKYLTKLKRHTSDKQLLKSGMLFVGRARSYSQGATKPSITFKSYRHSAQRKVILCRVSFMLSVSNQPIMLNDVAPLLRLKDSGSFSLTHTFFDVTSKSCQAPTTFLPCLIIAGKTRSLPKPKGVYKG